MSPSISPGQVRYQQSGETGSDNRRSDGSKANLHSPRPWRCRRGAVSGAMPGRIAAGCYPCAPLADNALPARDIGLHESAPAVSRLEQHDEWAVQRARYMTLETMAPLSDD